MIGKIILSLTLFGIIYQGSFAEEEPVTNKQVAKVWAKFDLNVDGSNIPYRVDSMLLNYYIPRLHVDRNKDSNSAAIKLSALLALEHGDFLPEDKRHGPLSYVTSQFLDVNIVGTAQLIHGGPYLKNCQFTFTQTTPIKDKLPALVKETLLKEKLNEFLAEQLCKTINETIE